MFPVIKTIDDVLPVIKDNENFSVNHKDDYIVIDYILNSPEFFNNPIEKECRGLIFHEYGDIMARRYHKFFNFNERPESSIENIDFSKPHIILEKLDGSMITPMWARGNFTWGSKAGETFLTPQIEEFVKNNPQYIDFALMMIKFGLTPIFEWCSRKNRIVIDHPVDRLVLTGMRANVSGDYCQYNQLVGWAKKYCIDYVKPFRLDVGMEDLYEYVKRMKGIEGFVVRFEDGHMIKIKCDEYVRCHRAKDTFNLEKNVISIIANQQADDFRTLLSELDRRRFEEFEEDFLDQVRLKAKVMNEVRNGVINMGMSRKDFAISSSSLSQYFRSIVFELWGDVVYSDGVIVEKILEVIKKNVSSATTVDRVRHLFGGISWYDYH